MSVSSSRRNALTSGLVRAVRVMIAGSSLFNLRMAERLGIHPTDLQVLNLLDLFGPLTPSEIARYGGLTSGGVTVVVDRLEDGGYVRRKRSAKDRRSVTVEIVAARRRKVTSNYDAIQEHFESLLETLPERKLEIMLEVLTKMNEGGRPPLRD
jgi:MarR family transcriptional regulator, organic hydroperoxide resistance regulator